MLNTETVEKVEQSEKASTPEQKQDKINKAFVESGKKTVHGLELKPYSASREAAAQAMGLHYANVDKAGQERYARTHLYPGAIRDVAIIIWLCAKATEDEIDGAGIEPKAASRSAMEWAREEGLFDTGSEKFADCYDAMFEILENIWQSRSSAQKKITSQQEKPSP